MIKSGAKIDLASLEVVIGQDQISISVDKRPSQVKVCVVESLEIPARSEALLTGQLSGLSGRVLAEPKYEISSNNSLLYPARYIAHVECNRLPINMCGRNCGGESSQKKRSRLQKAVIQRFLILLFLPNGLHDVNDTGYWNY